MNRSRKQPAAVSGLALGVLGAAAMLGAPDLRADDAPDLLTDPFSVSLGTFIVQTEPTVQLDGDTTAGDKIDFDSEIGGADVNRFRLDAAWRFGETDRHKLRGFLFNVSRSRKKTINEDIVWGDDTYPVNAKVEFKMDFSVAELAYEYEFLKRDNYEVGASAGLHYTTFGAELRAKASESGGSLSTDIKNEGSVDLPLPVFGLQGTWRLPANLYANLSAQWFALSIDEYDGSLQDYRATLTWQPKSWLGIGIGYDQFSIDVDVQKDRFEGSLDWTYSGPMIFYNASF